MRIHNVPSLWLHRLLECLDGGCRAVSPGDELRGGGGVAAGRGAVGLPWRGAEWPGLGPAGIGRTPAGCRASPPQPEARTVLAAIGSGERTFIGATPLQRALELLTNKRIVAAELPVSLRPSKDRRYRVTDPYLRFWLHLLSPSMEEIERGRGDLTLVRIRESWTSWAWPSRLAPCPRGPDAGTAR